LRTDGLAYINDLVYLMDKHNLPHPEAIVLTSSMYEDIEEHLENVWFPWAKGERPIKSTRMKMLGITVIKGIQNV